MKYLIFTYVFFFNLTSLAQISDDLEIKQMFEDDQNSRMSMETDWQVMHVQDSLRLIRVFELSEQGRLQTANDYYHCAMICQHGGDTIASSLAVKYMEKATELDSTMSKWLLAAAIDRDLMYRDKPQIFGTQYVKKGPNARFVRWEIDTTRISDDIRIKYQVETLAEQKHKEWKLNLLNVSDFYNESKDIKRTIELINSEFVKGYNAEYDVEEYEINVFGYELMNSGKMLEALAVFELNTKLYPDGFNTYDSYGECLLKLNKRKRAIRAYRKSLLLNPANENARKIISELD
jgi:tetratricopeptide (TPR) repeat protein